MILTMKMSTKRSKQNAEVATTVLNLSINLLTKKENKKVSLNIVHTHLSVVPTLAEHVFLI